MDVVRSSTKYEVEFTPASLDNDLKQATQHPSVLHALSVVERSSAIIKPSAISSFSCYVCRKVSPKMHCQACKEVYYCSRKCQIVHWKFHKPYCQVKRMDFVAKTSVEKEDPTVTIENTEATDLAVAAKKVDSQRTSMVGSLISTATEVLINPLLPYFAGDGGDSGIPVPTFGQHQSNNAGQKNSKIKLNSHSSRRPKKLLPLHRKGTVGITNIGNSCYLNSGIQCLSHIAPLTSYFLSDDYMKAMFPPELEGIVIDKNSTRGMMKRSHEFCLAFKSLLQQLWLQHIIPPPVIEGGSGDARGIHLQHQHMPVSAGAVKQQLGRINEDYAGLQQQDTHDVLETILDQLHEDFNIIRDKPYVLNVEGTGVTDVEDGCEAHRRHLLRDNSVIDDLLGGQCRSCLTCLKCGEVSVSFEHTRSLSLAIPPSPTRIMRITYMPRTPVCVGGYYTPQLLVVRVAAKGVSVKNMCHRLCRSLDFVSKHKDTFNTGDVVHVPVPTDVVLFELTAGDTNVIQRVPCTDQRPREVGADADEAADSSPNPQGLSPKHCTKRAHMHTVCRIFEPLGNRPEVNCAPGVGRELIAFELPPPIITKSAQLDESLLVIYQRRFVDEVYEAPLTNLPTLMGSELAAAPVASYHTSVKLMGVPLIVRLNMDWSCAKVKYVLWEQVRQYVVGVEDGSLLERLNIPVPESVAASGQYTSHIATQLKCSQYLHVRLVDVNGKGVVSHLPNLSSTELFHSPKHAAGTASMGASTADYCDQSVFGSLVPYSQQITIGTFMKAVPAAQHGSVVFLAIDWVGPLWAGFVNNSLHVMKPKQSTVMWDKIDEVNVFIVHSDMRSTAVEEKSNSSDMHIYPTQQDEDELISLQNITEVCVGSENKKDRRAKVPSRELTHVLTTFSALPSLDSTFPITLESCFRHYTGTEVLDGDNAWYCKTCKTHVPAEKNVNIWKLPNILMITLKRFEFSGEVGYRGWGNAQGGGRKLDMLIDFPIDGLDVAPYFPYRGRCRTFSSFSTKDLIGIGSNAGVGSKHSSSSKVSPSHAQTHAVPPVAGIGELCEEESTLYDLFAVCNHFGRVGFGHYTAMARDLKTEYPSTGQEYREHFHAHTHPVRSEVDALNTPQQSAYHPWYHYDDAEVTLLSEQDVKTNAAYILFYRKRHPHSPLA